MKVKDKKKKFEQGQSFLEYLSYAGYDEDKDIYEMDDGSIGACYKVALPPCEFDLEEQLDSIADKWNSFLKRLEPGTTVQAVLTCNNNISDELNAFSKRTSDSSNPIINAAMEMRRKTYEMGTVEPLFDYGNLKFFVKHIYLIITIRYFPKNKKVGMFESIFKGGAESVLDTYKKNEQKNKYRLSMMMNEAEQTFSALQTDFGKVKPDELISVIYPILNRKRSFEIPSPKYNPNKDIREQVLYDTVAGNTEYWIFEPKIDLEGKITEGTYTSVVSAKDLPDSTFPTMIVREMEGKSIIDDMRDFTMVFNIYVDDPYKERVNVEKKKADAEKKIVGRVSEGKQPNQDDQFMMEECNELMTAITINNHRIINTRVHVIIQGESYEEFEHKRNEVLRSLDRINLEGVAEKELGAGLFLSCLPLNFEASIERTIRRTKKALTRNVSHMLPVYGNGTGTESADVQLVNRRGQLSRISCWDTDGAPHGVIIGTSGSGKSFFTGHITMSWLRQETKVIVFDRGNSYKTLCRLYGGQTMNINPDRPTTINPFYGILKGGKDVFLKTLLPLMASGGKERDELPQEMENFLAKVVRSSFYNKQFTNTFTSDEEIEEALNSAAGVKVFIHHKRNRRFVDYVSKDVLMTLRDEIDEEENNLNMEVYELCSISKEEYESKKEQYDGVLKERKIKIFENYTEVDITITSEEQRKEFISYVENLLRQRGRVSITSGEYELSKGLLSKFIKEHELGFSEEGENIIIDYHKLDQFNEIKRIVGRELKEENYLEEIKIENDKVILTGSNYRQCYYHVDKKAEENKYTVEKRFSDYLIEFADGVDMQAISGVYGSQPNILSSKLNIYVEGDKERNTIRGLSGLNTIYEDEVGTCIYQKEVYFSDVANELTKLSADKEALEIDRNMASSLHLKLGDYFGKGAYAGFFDGPMQFDIESKYTVIETGELNTSENWTVCYLLNMFNMVYEYFQRSEIVGMPKYLLLEEGWSFLQSKRSAEFLQNVYRTGRKFGFSCFIITQQADDFLSFEAGRAIFANSPNRFLLMQEKDTIPRIAKEMQLSDVQRESLITVRTHKGYYSEVYLKNQRSEGIYRLIPDPIMYWVMTTDKDDKPLREKYRKVYKEEGFSELMSMAKSILRCALEYPSGVRRAPGDPNSAISKIIQDIELT